MSTDTIVDPQPTGQGINLPFYPGCRYAAIPGQSSNGVVEVDIYPSRPESLVYHDHSCHLMDLKVILSLSCTLLTLLLLRFLKISSLVMFLCYYLMAALACLERHKVLFNPPWQSLLAHPQMRR